MIVWNIRTNSGYTQIGSRKNKFCAHLAAAGSYSTTNLNLTPGEYRDYYNIAIDVKDTAGPGGYEALDAFISTKSTGRESLSERLSRACADSARQVSSMELDIERSHQERSLGDAR